MSRVALHFDDLKCVVPLPPEGAVLGRLPALGITDRLVSREHVRVCADPSDAFAVVVTQLGLRPSLVNGALLPRLASAKLRLGQSLLLVPTGRFSFTVRLLADAHATDTETETETATVALPERPTLLAPSVTLPVSVPSAPTSQAVAVAAATASQSQSRRHMSAFEAEVLHFASSLLGADDDVQRMLSERERQWLVTAAALLRKNLCSMLTTTADELRVCQAFFRALLTGESGVADDVLASDAWYWYTAQVSLRDRRAAQAAADAAGSPVSRGFSRTVGDVGSDDGDGSDSDAAAADKELLANVSALDDIDAVVDRASAAKVDVWWMDQARRRQSASLAPVAGAGAAAPPLAPSAELDAADQTTQHNDVAASDQAHSADSLATGVVSDYALVASERGQSRFLPTSARIANVDELRLIGSCRSTLLGLWTLGDISKRDDVEADAGADAHGAPPASEAAVFLPLRPYILVARAQARSNGIALVDSHGFVMASFVAPPLVIDGAVLFITDWRCVHWRGRCYVEVAPRGYVMLAPASDVDEATMTPLRGALTTGAAVNALDAAGELGDVAMRALAVAERGAKDAASKRFGFRARVAALSPAVLMVPSDASTVHYFAHVVGPDGARTSLLLMGERALLMRNFVHVGAVYTLSHLQVRRMFRGTARERFILASTDDTMLLTPPVGTDWPAAAPAATAWSTPAADEQQSCAGGTCVSQCITYRGCVSALLGRGVVELDGAVSLLLAHCQLLDQGLGIRVGALLVAHNVHVVEARGRVRALGVCALSHVAIVRHSPLNVAFVPPCRKSSPLLHLQPQQRVGFARFLWLFDVQRALSRKFPRHACTDAVLWGDVALNERGALARLLDAVRAPQLERQMYTEFLDHERACWLGERLDASGAPLLLDVRSLAASDGVRAARRAALDEARFVAQQLLRWQTMRLTNSAAAASATVRERRAGALATTVGGWRDALLIGQLVLGEPASGEPDEDDDVRDGDCCGRRLRMCDATGAIDVLVAGNRAVSIRDLGQIFLVERYSVIVEGVPHRVRPQSDAAAAATPRTPRLTPGAAAGGGEPGDRKAVRITLLLDDAAPTLIIGDLADPSLTAALPAGGRATPDDTPAAGGASTAVRGRSRLQALRARRSAFLAATLECARVAARGLSTQCVLCVVHSVAAVSASAFDAHVSIQLATRVNRTKLRFAGRAARWWHVVAPDSCVVVSSLVGDRVSADALVFTVCFDEQAAARGGPLARWNLAYGLNGGGAADELISAGDAVQFGAAAGDVVLALLDPRLSGARGVPVSLRAVLSLAAHDAVPAAVVARVHERQWMLAPDAGDAPWLRLELRDVDGPDFCAAWLPAHVFDAGALLPGAVIKLRGVVRAVVHDSLRLTGAACVTLASTSGSGARRRSNAAQLRVIVDNGELFRASLADVETCTIADFREQQRRGAAGAVATAMTPRSSVALAAERAAVYRVVATVAGVTSVRVVWQCRRCGRAIPNQCRADCSWPEFALRVVVLALIDDGTAPAAVRAVDEFAATLLQLDGDDVRVLRMACYTHGAVEWQGNKRHAVVNAAANTAWLDDLDSGTGQRANHGDGDVDVGEEAALAALAAANVGDLGAEPAKMRHPALALVARRASEASQRLRRVALFCRQLRTGAGGGAQASARDVQLFAHRIEHVDVHTEARQLLESMRSFG
jgi:hypothetical protein